mmetsp:Transcript_39060/g.110630  ORF Transcript_39060/g.110630 Transcript_39060/m.110630 type:complete len:235 (+) Transcript_39060:96-800(+)
MGVRCHGGEFSVQSERLVMVCVIVTHVSVSLVHPMFGELSELLAAVIPTCCSRTSNRSALPCQLAMAKSACMLTTEALFPPLLISVAGARDLEGIKIVRASIIIVPAQVPSLPPDNGSLDGLVHLLGVLNVFSPREVVRAQGDAPLGLPDLLGAHKHPKAIPQALAHPGVGNRFQGDADHRRTVAGARLRVVGCEFQVAGIHRQSSFDLGGKELLHTRERGHGCLCRRRGGRLG